MTDIAEFIRARLDEAEQEIHRRMAIPTDWAHDGPCVNYEGQDPADRDEYDSCSRHVAAAEAKRADRFPYRDLEFGLREVAAHRAILTEHWPVLRTVEWPHDQTGTGEAPVCPRCQNAEHSYWNPPQGQAGALPEGFVTPYVLAPCRTLLALASVWSDHPDHDQAWTVE